MAETQVPLGRRVRELRETAGLTRQQVAVAAGLSVSAGAAADHDALEEAADHLQAEARRRAVDGVKKLKFYNGRPVIDPATGQQYYEHEYSDSLLMALLRGLRPHIFGDAVTHRHQGSDGPPIRQEV